MRRIDRMTNEEVVELLINPSCNTCEARHFCAEHCLGGCKEAVGAYLSEEISTKPRWATIKSNEDIDKLWDEFLYTTYEVEFTEWLKEQVEI